MEIRLSLIVLLSILTNLLAAQTQFEEVQPSPPASQIFMDVAISSIAFADIDNDSDQDVLITGLSSSAFISKLYTNDGTGNYIEKSDAIFEGVNNSSIAFSDVDNDGDQDLLITGNNNSNVSISKLYLNNGSGDFTEDSNTLLEGVKFSSIAFSDVDNDEDQDLLITGQNNLFQSISKLYTNDGLGNFSENTDVVFGGVYNSSITFSDTDNDNDQDVLITGQSSLGFISKLYINDGSGIFIEDVELSLDGVRFGSVAFADIDNDNDQDLLITGQNSNAKRISKLYHNDGLGSYTENTDVIFDGVYHSSIAFADIDNDNDQDVLITGSRGNSGPYISKLYTNNGTGEYTEDLSVSFQGVWLSSIAFADIDNDMDEDLLITGQLSSGKPVSKLYENVSTLNSTNQSFNTEFKLFPNPSSDASFTIKTPYENTEVNVKIINLLGQKVYDQMLTSNMMQKVTIEATGIATGIYEVILKRKETIFSTKLLVQ